MTRTSLRGAAVCCACPMPAANRSGPCLLRKWRTTAHCGTGRPTPRYITLRGNSRTRGIIWKFSEEKLQYWEMEMTHDCTLRHRTTNSEVTHLPYYPFLEEIVILGVLYGSLARRSCKTGKWRWRTTKHKCLVHLHTRAFLCFALYFCASLFISVRHSVCLCCTL